MKKILKRIGTGMIVCLMIAVAANLTGCGDGGVNNYNSGSSNNSTIDYEKPENASDDMFNGNSSDASEKGDNESRKIIETVSLTMETKDFESLISQIEAETREAGGYIENSNISGGSDRYNSTADHSRRTARSAYIKIRIPASVDDSFSDFIYENANVTKREIVTEDITLTYVDIESRIQSYKTEKDALEKLLAEATSVEDIIIIQDRLTDVIYNIESAQSKLRTYDNLVDYTTFNLNISEVETITPVNDQGIWQEIGANLKNNFNGVLHFFERVFVIFVSCIPQLAVIGIIAVVIVIIVKVSVKRKKKKSQKYYPTRNAEPNEPKSED